MKRKKEFGQNEFKEIFPNGDYEHFKSYKNLWEGDVDRALWSYGEYRRKKR